MFFQESGIELNPNLGISQCVIIQLKWLYSDVTADGGCFITSTIASIGTIFFSVTCAGTIAVLALGFFSSSSDKSFSLCVEFSSIENETCLMA